ncbi:hypothetical protein HQ533_01010 [Candidatus Woesearchaeota archaeon]|nr:hypothetical protein [Candidatus Woesearchaeota archaeon]
MGGLEGIVEKSDRWFTDHPKTTSLLTGIGIFSLFEGGFLLVDNLAPDRGIADNSLIKSGIVGTLFSFYCHNVYLKGKIALEELGLSYQKVKEYFKRRKLDLKKQDVSFFANIKDRILEHPKTVGILGAGLTLAHLIRTGINSRGLDGFIDNVSDNYGVMIPVTALTLGVAYRVVSSIDSYLGGLFHSSNYPSFKNQLRFKRAKKKGDMVLMKEIALETPYDAWLYEYAGVCVDKGDYFEALDVLKQVYDKNKPDQFFSANRTFDFMNFRERLVKHLQNLKANERSFSDRLKIALDYMRLGEKQKAMDMVHGFVEVTRSDELALSADVSEAVFLHNIGERERFRGKVFSIIKEELDKLVFSVDGYCFIDDNDFTRHALALKRSNTKRDLDDERKYTGSIKTSFDEVNDESRFRIIDPFEIVGLNSYYYGAMNFEVGEPLYRLMQSRDGINVLKDVARFMARIHGANKLFDPVQESTYKQELLSRTQNVTDSRVIEAMTYIENNLDFLLEDFESIPRVVDVDGHRFNWIVGDHYTKIDNEKRNPTPPLFECSKLLEQGNSIPFTEEGDQLKDGVLLEYYRELSNFHSIMPFDEFVFYKLKSDVVKAVSFSLFALDQPSKYKVADEFLDNAIHSINRLDDYFVLKQDTACLKETKRGVAALRTVLV